MCICFGCYLVLRCEMLDCGCFAGTWMSHNDDVMQFVGVNFLGEFDDFLDLRETFELLFEFRFCFHAQNIGIFIHLENALSFRQIDRSIDRCFRRRSCFERRSWLIRGHRRLVFFCCFCFCCCEFCFEICFFFGYECFFMLIEARNNIFT